MNLQQLEYIVAVDLHRNFLKASEACFVTQPTLSMMIRKLEEELDVQLFDRDKHPVIPTEAGASLIAQARTILREASRMRELVSELKGELKGELRLGIIPTIAPYLLPLFLDRFLTDFPGVKMKLVELTTEQLIGQLKDNRLDAAIMATPIHQPMLKEQPLFWEEFVVYAAKQEKLMKKKYILPADIDVRRLWLLEEGHCLRMQVINLCELRKQQPEHGNLEYEAGSIETLLKMVDAGKGITIIPELAALELTKKRQQRLRQFKSPAPAREVSLVTYRHFVKQKLLEALKNSIMQAVPPSMHKLKNKSIAPI